MDAEHIGIEGYSNIGTKSVFTSVALILGDKFLNLFKLVRTALPLFFYISAMSNHPRIL